MATVIVSTSRRLWRLMCRVYSLWERVQVSRHGVYTGRRARALQRYVQTVSLVRVLAVCLGTPLPILGFVLLQEGVPLAPPTARWQANYRWFIRSAVIFMVLTLSYIQQGIIFLAPLKVSVRQAFGITLSTTGTYFAVIVALSSFWGFPIPFSCVFTTGAFTCLFFGFFVAIIGWRTISNTPRLSSHARVLRRVLVVKTILVIVYPAFNAVFRLLGSSVQQGMLVIFLFLLKVVMRLAMVHALRLGKGGMTIEERWRARLPEIVVFSTELFHVLYLTACLQSIHVTVMDTIGLSLFDACVSTFSLRGLLKRSPLGLMSRPSHNVIVPAPDTKSPTFSLIPTNDSATSWWVSSQRHTSSRVSTSRQVSATRRLSRVLVSSSNLKLVRRSSSRSSNRSNNSSSRSFAQVALVSCESLERLKRSNHDMSVEISKLQTLSMIEYFLLVEYVKCIIPILYGIFQAVLSRLPNAVYYPIMASADRQRTQTNMAVYAALHSLSFSGFVLLLRRHMRYSVLHQLAFVLETAADDIQAKLAIFIPYCFYFFLEHNGVDYSFQFAWMDKQD